MVRLVLLFCCLFCSLPSWANKEVPMSPSAAVIIIPDQHGFNMKGLAGTKFSNQPEAKVTTGDDKKIKLEDIVRELDHNNIRVQAFPDPDFIKLREEIVGALEEKMNGGIIITGDAGVGKSAMTETVMVELQLMGWQVYKLEVGGFLSGTSLRGQAEEKVQVLINELADKKAVLFIDAIHTLKGAGSGLHSDVDFFQILAPYLANGRIKIVGTTTDSSFNMAFSTDTTVTNSMFRHRLSEPQGAILRERLQSWVRQVYGAEVANAITPTFLDSVIEISNKFSAEGAQPTKATKYLQYILRYAQDVEALGVEDIYRAASRMYSLDIQAFSPDHMEKRFETLRNDLDIEIVGQDKLKEKIMDKSMIGFAGLTNETLPKIRLLITGPKGQGKTRIVFAYAKSMGLPIKRFTMSSYSANDIEKLKYEVATEVKKNAFMVLLFDEIDKTHKDIQNALLELLDSGKVEVSYKHPSGNRVNISVDARNTSVFFTANAIDKIAVTTSRGIGFLADQSKTQERKLTASQIEEALEKEGKISEYLLDRIETFLVEKSDKDEFREILARTLAQSLEQVFKNRKIKVSYKMSDIQRLAQELTDKYYNEEASNREVARLVENHFTVPMGKYIIKNPRQLEMNLSLQEGRVEFSPGAERTCSKLFF